MAVVAAVAADGRALPRRSAAAAAGRALPRPAAAAAAGRALLRRDGCCYPAALLRTLPERSAAKDDTGGREAVLLLSLCE